MRETVERSFCSAVEVVESQNKIGFHNLELCNVFTTIYEAVTFFTSHNHKRRPIFKLKRRVEEISPTVLPTLKFYVFKVKLHTHTPDCVVHTLTLSFVYPVIDLPFICHYISLILLLLPFTSPPLDIP